MRARLDSHQRQHVPGAALDINRAEPFEDATFFQGRPLVCKWRQGLQDAAISSCRKVTGAK